MHKIVRLTGVISLIFLDLETCLLFRLLAICHYLGGTISSVQGEENDERKQVDKSSRHGFIIVPTRFNCSVLTFPTNNV